MLETNAEISSIPTVWRQLLRRDTRTADSKSHGKPIQGLNKCATCDGLQRVHVCGSERRPAKICGLKRHQKLKRLNPRAGEETQRLSAARLESHHSISIFPWHQRACPEAVSVSHHKHHTAKLWSSLRPKPCQYKSYKILSSVCHLNWFAVSNGPVLWGRYLGILYYRFYSGIENKRHFYVCKSSLVDFHVWLCSSSGSAA